jgi:hypothetical protein
MMNTKIQNQMAVNLFTQTYNLDKIYMYRPSYGYAY